MASRGILDSYGDVSLPKIDSGGGTGSGQGPFKKPSQSELRQQEAVAQEAMYENFANSAWQNLNALPGLQEGSVREWRRQTDFYLKDTLPKFLDSQPQFQNNQAARDEFLDEVSYRVNNKLQEKIKPVENASRLDAVGKSIGAAMDRLVANGKGLWGSLISRATGESVEDDIARTRIIMDDLSAAAKADLERQQDNAFYQNMRREEQEDALAEKGFVNSIMDSDHPVQKIAHMLASQVPQLAPGVLAGTVGGALGGALTRSPAGAWRGAQTLMAATGMFLGMSEVASNAFMDIYQADQKELENIEGYKDLREIFRKKGFDDEQADDRARAAVAYAAMKEHNLEGGIPGLLLSFIGPEAAIVQKSLVNTALKKGIFKRSFPARAAARIGIGATGEGLEEYAEGVASKYIANSTLGRPTDIVTLSEGGMDNFLGGVVVGGPFGALGNINEARRNPASVDKGNKPQQDSGSSEGPSGGGGGGGDDGQPPAPPSGSAGTTGGENIAEQIVPGMAQAQEQRRSAEQALRSLDDYFAPWRSATTTVTASDLNDQQVTELAQYINTVQQGSNGRDIIGQYFAQLDRDTGNKISISPQEVLRRYSNIQKAGGQTAQTAQTGAPVSFGDDVIDAAKAHLWERQTKYQDVDEYISAMFGKDGTRTYTGIDPLTGTQFTVPMDKISLGARASKLTKGLDPNSHADQEEFFNRALSEFATRGMDRSAAELAATAATRVFSTTGKVRANELRRALVDIGETNWSTVANTERGNANNTAGSRAAGGAAGQAGNTGPGNTSQNRFGNSQPDTGGGPSAQGGGSGGAARPDTGTAPADVYPAEPAAGPAGDGTDSGSGGAEPAADGAGSPAGERGPAGPAEQRPVNDGLNEETGSGTAPGISYTQLNDILKTLRFNRTGEQAAARSIYERTLSTLISGFRQTRGEPSRDTVRALQVGAMVHTRLRLYIAQVARVSVNNIMNTTVGIRQTPENEWADGRYIYPSALSPTGSIWINTKAFKDNTPEAGAYVSSVLAHETVHAFVDTVYRHRALLSYTERGRTLLDTMDRIAEVCGAKNGKWTGSAEEHFAVALQSYLETNKLPVTFGELAHDTNVQNLFAAVAEYFRSVCAYVRGFLTRVLGSNKAANSVFKDMSLIERNENYRKKILDALGGSDKEKWAHFRDLTKYHLPEAAYLIEGKLPGPVKSLFKEILEDTSAAVYDAPGADNTSPVVLAELHNAEIVIANRLMTTGYEGLSEVNPVEAMNIAHQIVDQVIKQTLRSPEQRAAAYNRKSQEATVTAEVVEPGVIEETDGEGIEIVADDATVETAEQGIINPDNDPEGAVETTGPDTPANPGGVPDAETENTARVTATDSIVEEIDSGAADTTPTENPWRSTEFINNEFDADGTVLRGEDGLPRSVYYRSNGFSSYASADPLSNDGTDRVTYIRTGRMAGAKDKLPALEKLRKAKDLADLERILSGLRGTPEWAEIQTRFDTIELTLADGQQIYMVLNANMEAQHAYDAMRYEQENPGADIADVRIVDMDLPDDAPGAPGMPGGNPYSSIQHAMAGMASIIARRAAANSRAAQAAQAGRDARKYEAESYSYTQAQRAGWWQRFARTMREAWDNKSWLYMWNVNNNAPTVGQAWSSPLNNAIYSTGARVDGARTEITRRFIDPLNDWARVKARDLGLGDKEWSRFLHDMGNARTFLHTIESSALRRQQLQDALLQAYTLPFGADRIKAISQAQDNIAKYNAKQANKAIKNGVYLDGGRTESECVQGYNDLVARYGQNVVEEGVERIGQSMEGLVQHLIEQDVISETDIMHFREFAYYVPLMTQQDIRRNDDITEIIASPNLMIEREGAETPAVDGVSTLEKYAGRAANAIGARDLGVELRNTYLRMRQQFKNGDASITHVQRVLFRSGSDTQSINYYNGLGMMDADILRAASMVSGQNNTNAQYIRDTANQILNNKHIIVRVVEDTDMDGNPQIPVTKSYVVWFNREEMQGINGNGDTVTQESNSRVNDALHSIYENSPPVHMKTMRKLTRFYGSLNTTWKVTFPVYNAQNDFFERLAYTASRTFTTNNGGVRSEINGLKIARSMLGYAVNPLLQMRVLFSYGWNGNVSRFNARDRAFMEEFRDSGIMSSTSLAQYLRRQGDTAYAFLTSNPAVDQSLLSKLKNNPVQRLFHRWADMWYTMAPAIEYMAMRKNGISAENARSFVLEQMNMRVKGGADKFMGWALPFIPSIGQTTLNFTNMLGLNATTFGHTRSRGAQVRALGNWIGIGVFAWGASMLIPFLASAFGDGDDEKGYKDVLDRMDLASIDSIMVPGDDGQAVKLMRVGFGPGRFVLQAAFGLDRINRGTAEIGDVVKNLAASYVMNVSPFSQPVFDIKTVNDAGQKFAMMMTPVLLRPVAESFIYNRDFFGSPIARQNKYHDEKNRFSDERSGSTPRIWSDIAKGIYNVAGIDVYPEQIRNMVKGYATGPLQAMYKWFDNDPLVRDPAYAEHRSIIGDTLTLLGSAAFFYKYGDSNQRIYYSTQEMFDDILRERGLGIAMVGKGPYDKTNLDKQERVLRQAGFPPEFIRDYVNIRHTYYTLREMDKKYRNQVNGLIAGRGTEARLEAICEKHYRDRARVLDRAVKQLRVYQDPSLRHTYMQSGNEDNISRLRAKGFMERSE